MNIYNLKKPAEGHIFSLYIETHNIYRYHEMWYIINQQVLLVG